MARTRCAAYSRLRMHGNRQQVLGVDLNRSESNRPPLPFAPPHSATAPCSKGRLIRCTVPGLIPNTPCGGNRRGQFRSHGSHPTLDSAAGISVAYRVEPSTVDQQLPVSKSLRGGHGLHHRLSTISVPAKPRAAIVINITVLVGMCLRKLVILCTATVAATPEEEHPHREQCSIRDGVALRA
jgi:hypothetical protein